MRTNTKLLFTLFLLSSIAFAQLENQFNYFEQIKVFVKNPVSTERVDELVVINIETLLKVNSKFNEHAAIVYFGEQEVPSQLYSNEFDCYLLFTCDFKPNQTKQFSIKYLENGKVRKEYKNRTYAELAMKFNSTYSNKKFSSEPFQNFTKVVVPEIHTDHDALFKYEGPGWESEKVGYRFYLDWRNATDIFGKKTNDLILYNVGTTDLVAKDDSYHEMQEWGMDIFKVGSTLGIGSIGMMNKDSIHMVSKTEQVVCEIDFNGPILSEIKTNYKGWEVGTSKYDLVSKHSIAAGSRITNVNLSIYDNAENITTGLAKYEKTDFMKSNSKGDWQYIALYGKQTLNNDDLGIVLFYKNSDLIKQAEDKLNYYVTLKPSNNNLQYAFAAAWEKELDGIKNKIEFAQYINDEIVKLNNPLIIDVK